MNIDFSMTGLSFCLLVGITLLMFGICLFIMQNPIKHLKRFTARDYLIFSLIIVLAVGGTVMTVLGIIHAAAVINW